MRVLVFGADGQVGRELQRFPQVTALSRAEADLEKPGACAEVIAATEADAVINAAAYTAVDRAEEEEALATRINAAAPGEMARACAEAALPFLHVSTDYVFDGRGRMARRESARCHPLNAYGRSKRAGERAVAAAGGRWAVLRTSWVFSAHGNNFVKTMLRLSETRSELSVVDDQVGGPTPAADIARALISLGRALGGGHPGGIYHFAGQPAVSWAGFAQEVFARAGRPVTVTPIPTAQYPTPAVRPLNSRLDCGRITEDFGIAPPDWRRGLDAVLQELEATAT